MTSHPRPARLFCAFVLALAAAAPLLAANERTDRTRAVRLAKITVTGTVTDAVTGAPIKGAQVASGDSYVLTDDAGHYALGVVKSGIVTATHAGYLPLQKQASGTALDFALPQTPNITVKTTKGETFQFDAPSTKFGYSQIFQYTTADSPNLCRVNGTGHEAWTPSKAEMKRIIGPAHAVNAPACCDRGPVMAIDVELKSGEKTTGYLVDNCFGYNIEVIGIERTSSAAKFIPLSEVAEIVFP